jgi:hypothetical protein
MIEKPILKEHMHQTIQAMNVLTNLLGPVDIDVKKRLRTVLRYPTRDNWKSSRSLIIHGGRPKVTLWQAVIEINSMFKEEELTPSQAYIALAILHVASMYHNNDKANKAYTDLMARVMR